MSSLLSPLIGRLDRDEERPVTTRVGEPVKADRGAPFGVRFREYPTPARATDDAAVPLESSSPDRDPELR